MSVFTSLYKKTEVYVTEMFQKIPHPQLRFHNLEHTENVVKRVNEIAGHYNLSEDEMAALFVAAWFHDTGYLVEKPELHELKSVELMKEFLEKEEITSGMIEKIEACILATRSPRNPTNLISEILCDADTYQFGNKVEFKKSNALVFEEVVVLCGKNMDKKTFDEGALRMLQHHTYYTSYCKDLLNDTKKEITKKVKKSVKKEDVKKNEKEQKQHESLGEKEITEKDGTTKGMQTMLRLTSSNHIQLSEMADSKANILISVNAIIISVILSVLLRKLQTDPYLTIPTILFLTFSVLTIVVAILATRPKVNTGKFEDIDIVNKKTNLLFFGNFHKMTYEEYDIAMRTMMRDSDYLYSSIVKDIFYLGQVLGKKYKLIRMAYNIFMIGIIISVVAFVIAAIFNTAPPETVITNSTGSPF
ncbi:MAG: Pycsar system effector family protein [Ferruginibacter sp.]